LFSSSERDGAVWGDTHVRRLVARVRSFVRSFVCHGMPRVCVSHTHTHTRVRRDAAAFRSSPSTSAHHRIHTPALASVLMIWHVVVVVSQAFCSFVRGGPRPILPVVVRSALPSASLAVPCWPAFLSVSDTKAGSVAWCGLAGWRIHGPGHSFPREGETGGMAAATHPSGGRHCQGYPGGSGLGGRRFVSVLDPGRCVCRAG
jgi:hypothetical protein